MKAIVVSNLGSVSLAITPEAIAQKTAVLVECRAITAVTDAAAQEVATRSLQQVKSLLKALDASRVEVKSPVLEIGKKIDSTARTYALELVTESERLLGLINAFYREQQRKTDELLRVQRDLEQRRQKRLEQERCEAAEAQRKLDEAARATKDAEEAQRLQAERERIEQERVKSAEAERQRAETAASHAVASPPKAPGMVVRKEWRFRVVDLGALYAAHPTYCRLEVNASMINSAIRVGLRDCPGLEIYEETTANVRTN